MDQYINHTHSIADNTGGSSGTKASHGSHTTSAASLPRCQQESILLVELRAMGFHSNVEILDSIRHLFYQTNKFETSQLPRCNPYASSIPTAGASTPLHCVYNGQYYYFPTRDQVMHHIIAGREGMAEATIMDEARKESERERRKEASEQRRKAIALAFQEELQQASIKDWKTKREYFPDSWLLKDAALCRNLSLLALKEQDTKNILVDILNLEKKTQKWFMSLPEAYFTSVLAESIKASKSQTSMQHILQREYVDLQYAVSSLSEYSGGVPRRFLQAHDAAKAAVLDKSNKGTKRMRISEDAVNDSDGDGDDAIVLVRTVQPAAVVNNPNASYSSDDEDSNNDAACDSNAFHKVML